MELKVEDWCMKRMVYLVLSHIIWRSRQLRHNKRKKAAWRQFPYEAQVIAEKLYVPWAITISDEGKLYFTERSGKVRVIENGKLLAEPLITFGPPFVSQGEGGLMGIVLDPNYLQNHYMYVMHSYTEENELYNRVVRLLENNNKAVIDKVLIDKIPGARIHNGGRLKIGSDQMLYITTGDAAEPELAQEITSMAGKILRIALDGSIPADNPIPNSPIYTLGHRNPQGLAWDEKNILYASEHGQSAHDEINRIIPGANYGWPLVQGDESSAGIQIQKPLIHSGEETWAPSGMTFLSQGAWKGRLLTATLRGQKLLVFSINEQGTEVEKTETWLENEYGRLREVIEAKDGSVYLTTNNRDGRGNPDRTDDKIIRLIPVKGK